MREKQAFTIFLIAYVALVGAFLVWLEQRQPLPTVEPVRWSERITAPEKPRRPSNRPPETVTKSTHLPANIPPASRSLKKLERARLELTAAPGALPPRTLREETHETIKTAPLAAAKLHRGVVKHKRIAPLPASPLPEERDRTIVSAVLLRASDKIQHLYSRIARRRPDASGKLTVRFVVDPTGRVVETQVVENQLRDPDLAASVCETIRQLTFPPVQEKAGLEMFRQTFLFQGV